MNDPLERFIRALQVKGCDPRSAGPDAWESKCPVHQGERRNLSVARGDTGAVVFHCHHADESGRASCDHEAIVKALGLSESDLFPESSRPARNGHANGTNGAPAAVKANPAKPAAKVRKVYRSAEECARVMGSKLGPATGCWIYNDAEGFELARVYRFDPGEGKEYRPVHPHAEGWSIGDPPSAWPIYRLPEVAKSSGTVWIVEGEKCADLAWSLGLIATTSAHGAQAAGKTDWTTVAGRELVICPDHGAAGQGYVASLLPILGALDPAPTVKVVRLPGLSKGEDIEQWIDQYPTNVSLEELRDLLNEMVECAELERLGVPTIVCGSDLPGEGLKRWTPMALDALKRTNSPPTIFQRDRKLVRLKGGNQDTPPSIENLSNDAMRGVLDRVANWGSEWTNGKGKKFIKFGPPKMEIVADILSLGEWGDGLPVLESVVEMPRFLADGKLLRRPGYHPEARLFYSPVPEVRGLVIPNRPTLVEVDAARRLLVEDLLGDFTWGNEASQANAVALILLPFVRLMISGPTPLHHIGATTEGTGKTLLATLCSFPSLGRELTPSAQRESEAEWRKAILAVLLSASSHFLIDNFANIIGWSGVPEKVESGVLAAVLTAWPWWSDRVLGTSHEVTCLNSMVWISTGNNTVFSRELNRRIVPIDLVSLVENPSMRTGFKHDPIEEWAKANRVDVLRACLTLVQAWIENGKPGGSQVMGKFESYAKIMGGILEVSGVKGFLENRQRLFEQNQEAKRWLMLVAEWAEKHATGLVRATDLYDLIHAHDELHIAFTDLLGDRSPISQKQRLGHSLERVNGQVWGDWRIVRSNAKIRGAGTCYRLQLASADYHPDGEPEDNPQLPEPGPAF